MQRTPKLILKMAVVLLALAVATPALAGVVMFKGKLRAGFGASSNADISNNGLPVCAPANGNVYGPNTFGTLEVQGFASQGTGPTPSIMFEGFRPLLSTGAGTNLIGYVGGNGGAFPRYRSTCTVFFPPFINPRLRSRTQVAGAGGPAPGGGQLGPASGFSFTGASATQTVPFFGTGTANKGGQLVIKGGNNYGGDFEFMTKGPALWSMATTWSQTGPVSGLSSGPGVQLGINLATTNGTGAPLATYGIISYVAGFLPTGPNKLGNANATWRTSADPQRLKVFGQQSSHTAGFANGFAYAFHTPGTVGGAHGAVKTSGGFPLMSEVQIRIAANQWTTGTVQHSDQTGDYTTTRGASGADAAATGPSGTTRQLQVVTPWSATIDGITGYGIFPLSLGFGGVAVLDYDIIPMPEPGALLSLGAGALALLGMARIRGRRN